MSFSQGMDSPAARVFSVASDGASEIGEFDPGAEIFSSATAAHNVFYVQQGEIRLYMINEADSSSRLLEILGPGQWFGTEALAGMNQYRTRAVAVTHAKLTIIRADQAYASLLQQPQRLIELVHQLASRVISAHEDASKLVFSDCNSRLIDTLVRFSKSAASSPREGGDVVLRITHDQLAQAVGVARETISLALTQLRQQNLLKTGRNQLFFNPQALEGFSRSSISTGSKRSDARRAVLVDSVAQN